MIDNNSETTADRFALIVADVATLRRCEVELRDGSQCQRRASWWWDFHGCTRGMACGQCIDQWRARHAGLALLGRPEPCLKCGRIFANVDQAYTAVAL